MKKKPVAGTPLPQRYTAVVLTLFLLIFSSYLLMAIQFPMAYIMATYEDLAGEWAQVFFALSAAFFSAKLAFSTSRYRFFFGVLAIACLYVAGEEISWGQRLFDFETPEFFKEHNIQKETNLHNFFTGPVHSMTKEIIEYALATGLVLYGLFFPLAVARHISPAIWLVNKGIPAPPFYLWPFFVVSGFLELGAVSFNEAELAEILVYFSLGLFAHHYWVAQCNDEIPGRAAGWKPEGKSRLSSGAVGIFIITIIMAAFTTTYCYATPHLKKRIESRFLNGQEKFAGRYERFSRWQLAAKLYAAVAEKEPGRGSILRKTARMFKLAGDEVKSREYGEKALQIYIERYNDQPQKVSTNLYLASLYKDLDKNEGADFHLQKALSVALERVEQKSDDDNAAYTLGKVYQQLGLIALGQKWYQKALDLDPYSTKYANALKEILSHEGDSDEDSAKDQD